MQENLRHATDRAFRVSFLGNLALASVKLVTGIAVGSPALIADGWHSASDVATHGGTWLAHRLGRRAPDEDHHYGHGKLEAFAGLVVGLLLVGGGAGVMVAAGVTEGHLEEGWRAALALGVALGSIAANLAMARVAQRGADGGQSTGLRALARDNGSDALSGVLVVGGIAASWAGIPRVEPVVAFAIGLWIVVMGLRSVREGFDVLVSRVPDPHLRTALETTAQGQEGVRGVQRVRVHPLGQGYLVDLEISVDGLKTVEEGHRIAHRVEDAVVEAHPQVREVHVHVNPAQRPAPGPAPSLER